MSQDSGVAEFYDDLAGDYHLIFEDWDHAIGLQAEILTKSLHEQGVEPGARVLDASCGIGTQALGLAAAGFDVVATDISAAEVHRCAAEAQRRGLTLTTSIADLRTLSTQVSGTFDAVLSLDNALPHLLTDEDMARACQELRKVAGSTGVLLASIRDYDAVLLERPTSEAPRRRVEAGGGEAVTFQLWDWVNEDQYRVRHFTLTRSVTDWRVTERRVLYRAWTRSHLGKLMRRAGFVRVRWLMPRETGYYQPILVGTGRATPAE